jgi:hypothetical protein
VAAAIGSTSVPDPGVVESVARLLTEVNLARGKGVQLCRVIWVEVDRAA